MKTAFLFLCPLFFCQALLAQTCPCNCGCADTGQCGCCAKASSVGNDAVGRENILDRSNPYYLAMKAARDQDKPIVMFVGCDPVCSPDWAITLKKNRFPGYIAGDVAICVWTRDGLPSKCIDGMGRTFNSGTGNPYEFAILHNPDAAAIEAKRPVKKLLGYVGCETGKCTPVREWTLTTPQPSAALRTEWGQPAAFYSLVLRPGDSSFLPLSASERGPGGEVFAGGAPQACASCGGSSRGFFRR
jgi:hypothetical protein